jgi:hypothetical protein
MTAPGSAIPQSIYDGSRVVSSCSRWSASTFGSRPFAGLVNPWDMQATHQQEMLIAYLMGTIRLLTSHALITREEFVASVEEWLTDRKTWAQGAANETITAWNLDNPIQAQPELDVENLGYRNAEPPAENAFWPWSYTQESE